MALLEVDDLVAHLGHVGRLTGDGVGEPVGRPEGLGQLHDAVLSLQHLPNMFEIFTFWSKLFLRF